MARPLPRAAPSAQRAGAPPGRPARAAPPPPASPVRAVRSSRASRGSCGWVLSMTQPHLTRCVHRWLDLVVLVRWPGVCRDAPTPPTCPTTSSPVWRPSCRRRSAAGGRRSTRYGTSRRAGCASPPGAPPGSARRPGRRPPSAEAAAPLPFPPPGPSLGRAAGWGWAREPRQPAARRPAPLGHDDPRQRLAPRRPGGGRLGRRPRPGHLVRGPLPAPGPAPGHTEGARGREAHRAHRRRPRAPRPRVLRRAGPRRRRAAGSAACRPPPRRAARAPRLPRHPQPGGVTPGGEGFSQEAVSSPLRRTEC
jgi:hypothetical protein